MEYVSHLITQYHAVEQMYATDTSELTDSLQRSLVSMYATVLRFLVFLVAQLDRSGLKRFIKGLNPMAFDEVESLLGKINDNKIRVDSDASHVSNDALKKRIDITQQGQRYLVSQQQRLMGSQQDSMELQQQAEEQMQYLQRVLEESRDDMGELQDQVSEIYASTVETANWNQILDWLSPIRHDLYHSAIQKDILTSSGRWLFENPDFRDWRESAESAVLWMHGYLGTGKTRLVSILIEAFQSIQKDPFHQGRLAYFYCSRNEAGADSSKTASSRGEPLEVLRSLVKQLARARSGRGLETVVTSKYSQLKGSEVEEPRRLSITECVELMILLSKDSPTTVIVDALDECRLVGVGDLIQSLEEVRRNSAGSVKIFFSTRYVSAIVDKLNQYSWPSLEVSADKNGGDIHRFVDVELEKRITDRSLLHGHVSSELKADIRDTLAQRAGSMFWYASLQLNLLCDPSAELDELEVRQKLNESPTNLREAYIQIISDIEDPKNSQKSRSVASKTINWLLCAQEPIKCDAFLEAIGDGYENVDREFITRVCRSLVVEDKENDVFEFAHLSVREHLEQTQEYRPSAQHLVAAERCIKMVETSFLSSAMSRETTPSKTEFKRYAFLYWPLHYQQVDFDEKDDRKVRMRNKLKSMLTQGSGISRIFKQWISQVKTMEQGLDENTPLASKLKSLQASPGEPETALFTACVFGFDDLVEKFKHTKGFDPDQCNIQHQTPLCLAIDNNQIKTVKALVELAKYSFPPLYVNKVNYWALTQFDQFQSGDPPPDSQQVIIYATALQAAAAQGLEPVARYLREQGAKVDLVAGYYGNALQAAALKGHDNLVRIFLEEGSADPNSQGGFHGNALQAAAISGNAESVRLLIEHGALVSAPGGHYGSALMAAVCSNSLEILEILREQQADIDVKSRLYGTPIQKAADMNSRELLERLIAEGAEIDEATSPTENSDSQTGPVSALATAAWGGHSKIVTILLENGAQANTDRHGDAFHLLHQAASRGMLDLIRYCLDEKGCDINIATKGGEKYFAYQEKMTPLSFACAEGQLDTVVFLLERGADIEFEGDAVTPLQVAARRGHHQLIRVLVEHSRKRKGSLETKSFIDRVFPETGQSALFEAVLSGSLAAIDTLLEEGATYSSNKALRSPLHTAAIQNRPDIAHHLTQRYQDGRVAGDFSIDARDRDGKTPLLYGIENGSTAVITILLKNGADPTLCDNSDNSALHYAVDRNQEETLSSILSSHNPKSLAPSLEKQNKKQNRALNEAVEKRRYGLIKLLLAFGAKWHANDYRETSLHRAARGNLSLVLEYVKAFEGSDQLHPFLQSRNMYRRTPLHSAAEFNQPKIIQILLDYGADLMSLEHKSRTALFWATERGHTECARVLLNFAGKSPNILQPFVNHQNTWNRPALHETVMRRHFTSVQVLLDYEADLTLSDHKNETALILACRDEHENGYKDSDAIASILLQKAKDKEQLGVLINSHRSEHETALWSACHNNLPGIVSLLLDYGADYAISTIWHVTPLHIACWMKNQMCVEILLGHAAQDPDHQRFQKVLSQRDQWGRTPLNAAACKGQADIVALLAEKYHADYSIACPDGNVPEPLFTALHYAVKGGHQQLVETLLRITANDANQKRAQMFINAQQGQLYTALSTAAEGRHASVVRMLLRGGADYSIKNNKSATALTYGVCSGDLPTVMTLLEHVSAESDRLKVEVFLNARNNFGKTALMDGAERNFSPIVKVLVGTPGLDYTIRDNSGLTALNWTATCNCQGAASSILEVASRDKADEGRRFQNFLNWRAESNGHSALFDAAARGCFELTVLLLKDYHAAYDTYDKRGTSPIHVAVLKNHFQVADVYLTVASEDRDKDGGRFEGFLNKKDDAGKTALALAIENNDGRFMQLLKKYGAR